MLRRDIGALAGRNFDLAVIGGGIFGAAAALDAAQRGLDVALIERGDWCGATSAHSYKMIHGGIRYLQHGDVYRVRQSAAARSAFLRMAPHLVHPLPIAVPTYGTLGMKSKPVLRVGMALYDLLTCDRNRGISDAGRHIPWSWTLSADEVKRRYPGLERDGLTGAGVFCDGQMYNPPRIVLACVQSAAALGAAVANYTEATGFLREKDRIVGVAAKDRIGGDDIEIRANLTLNATGPYAPWLIKSGLGRPLDATPPFSRDAFFIVARPLFEGNYALAVPSQTADPDAKFSRGARHLFMVPWRGTTMVGVWHKIETGSPDGYEITDNELESWIAELNAGYSGLGLTLDDVSLGSAGLVPFGDNDPDASDLKYGHRSQVVDHREQDGIDGLMTLIGVRYTTGPYEAAGVIDTVMAKLDGGKAASKLAWTAVRGGDVPSFADLVTEIEQHQLATPIAEALAHNHGSAYAEVLREAKGAATLPDSTVLQAEIIHAARNEMACTLADVIFRRTDLATTGIVSDAALECAADLMTSACGWDEKRRKNELDFVRARQKLARTGRMMLADQLPG